LVRIKNEREGYEGICVDIHCHCNASNYPDKGAVREIPFIVNRVLGVKESYAKIEEVAKLQLDRGMDFPAISDHGTINAGKKLREIYGGRCLVNCEYVVKASNKGHQLEILCLNIDEDLHGKLLELAKEGVEQFVTYCKDNKVPHTFAHPAWFLKSDPPVQVEMFADWIQYFDTLEINGDMQLENELIFEIAKLHNKSLSGGSDDHMAIYAGTTFTNAPNAKSLDEFLQEFNKGNIQPGGIFYKTVNSLKREIYRGVELYALREHGFKKWAWTSALATSLALPWITPWAIPTLAVPLALGFAILTIPQAMAYQEKQRLRKRTEKLIKKYFLKIESAKESEDISRQIYEIDKEMNKLLQKRNFLESEKDNIQRKYESLVERLISGHELRPPSMLERISSAIFKGWGQPKY